MVAAVSTSEMSVIFYQTAQHNIQEDSHLHTCRSENLKSQLIFSLLGRTELIFQAPMMMSSSMKFLPSFIAVGFLI
jgi:hypothetical protein